MVHPRDASTPVVSPSGRPETPGKSDFLLILIPTDESGMEICVEEYVTASDQTDALLLAGESGHWRDVIGIYRHSGSGPLDDIWWAGPATVYGRRWADFRATTLAEPQGDAKRSEQVVEQPRDEPISNTDTKGSEGP